MIDLHLHTTASDGRSTPEQLVAAAVATGCGTIAVTDHDTVAGVAATQAAAAKAGIRFVTGIEMTAVVDGVDVHILGYCIDPADPALAAFLRDQREFRRERVVAIAHRLRQAGVPIDVEPILAVPPDTGRAVGRPAVARALIAAGHATDAADAFARFLTEGRPGFVPRIGPDPADVIGRIHDARGVASLAHPGKLARDQFIASMVAAGLDGIEVYHTDHSIRDAVRYQTLADRLGLLVTGGSDYHGPESGRIEGLGDVGLPPAAFERLMDRAARRH